MKPSDYALITVYFLVLGLFIFNAIEDSKYQEEQFKKINKLNNDLIKISQYVQSNSTDFEYLKRKIEDNSQEIEEVRRQLSETQNAAESFYNMFFDTQPQRIAEEQSQGAETNPPHITEGVNKQTLPPSEVSAPPPEKISTPKEREQEVVTAPIKDTPVPNKVIASCPRPTQNLVKYIANINLRRDYAFVASYDVADREIINLSFNRNIPGKLQRAIEKYLNSFSLTQDKQGCKLPIKLLRG
jgi:hypothetical protein